MSSLYRKYASNIWQSGSDPVTWSNLPTAKQVDNLASKARLNRGQSPKDVTFAFELNVDNVDIQKACLVVSLYEDNWGYVHKPSVVEFYDGSNYGNNAPDVIEPFYTAFAPTRVGTVNYEEGDDYGGFMEGDSWYKHFYELPSLTTTQAENLIVRMRWDVSPTYSLTCIGWCRMEMLTDEVTEFNVTMYSEDVGKALGTKMPYGNFTHYFSIRNDGASRYVYYDVETPINMDWFYSENAGVYENGKWKIWINKGETKNIRFVYKIRAIGKYTFYDVLYQANTSTIATKYSMIVTCAEADPDYSKEGVIYSLYPLYAHDKDDQYVDVRFNMVKSNCSPNFTFSSMSDVSGCSLSVDSCELLDIGKENVSSISYNDSTDTLSITLDNQSLGYSCWVRCYVTPTVEYDLATFLADREHYDDYIREITLRTHSNCSSKNYDVDINILPPRGHIVRLVSAPMNYKHISRISTNIGIPNVWTIRCKSHKRNYFRTFEPSVDVIIDDLISYIGCIRLGRPHKADATSDYTNTLINTRFENRVYSGKKGDVDETIKMTLRMPKENFTTLQGLVAMDKPIGVNTVPQIPDGDPINHRGWCEIYGVKGVKKINDMLYEGDVDVKYLKHDINTLFTVDKGNPVTTVSPPSVMTKKHEFGDKVTDLFDLSNFSAFNNIENEDETYVGNYTVDENEILTFKTRESISKFSDWQFRWRNIVPDLPITQGGVTVWGRSEDHDKNWAMSINLVDTDTNRKLVGYTYSNFKHYDGNLNKLLNTCDVTLQALKEDGTYDTKNYHNMSLLFNDSAPVVASNKLPTKLVIDTDDLIEHTNELLGLRLTDRLNNPIVDANVTVNLVGDNNLEFSYDVLTDFYGRVNIPIDLPDANYSVEGIYDGSELYDGSFTTGVIDVNIDKTVTYFNVLDQFNVYDGNTTKKIQLINGSVESPEGNGISGAKVSYQYKGLNGAFGGEQYLTTDDNGIIEVPVIQNNGNYTVRFKFRGNETYNPCSMDTECFVNITKGTGTQILSNDVTYLASATNRKFSIILQNIAGTPLPNETIKFLIYNEKQTFIRTAETDSKGVAVVDLKLPSSNWFIDTIFEGDTYVYYPCIATNRVIVKSDVKIDTSLVATSENYTIDNYTDNDFELMLKDYQGIGVPNQAVRFVAQGTNNATEFDGVIYTDANGKVKLPLRSLSNNVLVKAFYYGDSKYDSCNYRTTLNFIPVSNSNSTQLEISNKKIYLKSGSSYLNGYPIMVTITNLDEDEFNYSVQMELTSATSGVSLPDLKIGNYYVNATFKGNNGLKWCSLFEEDYEITTQGTLKDVDLTASSITADDGKLGTYTGTITDEDDLAMVGALVYITDGTTTSVAKTDGDGTFTFNWLAKYGVTSLSVTAETDYYHNDLSDTISTSVTSNSDITTELVKTYDGDSTANKNNQDYMLSLRDNEHKNVLSDYFHIYLINKLTREEMNVEVHGNDVDSLLSYFVNKGNWTGYIECYANDRYKDAWVGLDLRVDTDIKRILGSYDEYNLYYASEDTSSTTIDNVPFSEIKNKLIGVFTNLVWDDNVGNLVGTRLASSDINSLASLNGAINDLKLNNDGKLEFDKIASVTANHDLIGVIKDITVMNDGNIKVTQISESDLISSTKSSNINLELANLESGLTSEKVTLVARVYDKNGNPLANVPVKFYNKSGVELGVATSGNDGVATLEVNNGTSSMLNTDLAPQFEQYDGNTYGSTLKWQIRDNVLNITDYGYSEQSIGKIVENNIPFLLSDHYGIEIEIQYTNQSSERINPLEGLLQVSEVAEVSSDTYNTFYNDLVVTPSRIPYSKCVMTRLTEEGRIYYYNYDEKNHNFVGSPFNQYKGGVELKNELGSSLFNLDNAFSPIHMQNGLIRVSFHRRSGYVELSVYDASHKQYINTMVLKIDGYPTLSLPSNYDDDKVTLQFGQTYWTLYRGKPYVEVKHNTTDFKVLSTYDRVVTDLEEVGRNALKLVDEVGVNRGLLSTECSTQLFKQEWHIGESITLDNFKAYEHLNEGYLYNGVFYKDKDFQAEHPVTYTGVVGELYYDKGTKIVYTYNGTNYVEEN